MLVCPICGNKINEATNKCCRFPICHYVARTTKKAEDTSFVLFDLETTGVSRQKDRITEIGAIYVVNDTIVDQFSMLVNPGYDEFGNKILISNRITTLTGITNEMVRNQPEEKEAVTQFLTWVQEKGNSSCFAGQNVKAFDIPFLKVAAKRANIEFKPKSVIDTLVYAKRCRLKERGLVENYQQSTLAKHYNFSYNAHRAVDDVRACFTILQKLKEEAKTYGVDVVAESI